MVEVRIEILGRKVIVIDARKWMRVWWGAFAAGALQLMAGCGGSSTGVMNTTATTDGAI